MPLEVPRGRLSVLYPPPEGHITDSSAFSQCFWYVQVPLFALKFLIRLIEGGCWSSRSIYTLAKVCSNFRTGLCNYCHPYIPVRDLGQHPSSDWANHCRGGEMTQGGVQSSCQLPRLLSIPRQSSQWQHALGIHLPVSGIPNPKAQNV